MIIKILKAKIFVRLVITCIILMIAGIAGISGINAYVKHSVAKKILSPEEIQTDSGYDCILVLGCGVYGDGIPSPMLEDRLKRAIELYHLGAAPKLIMSGDHGQKNYDEVNTMREYAIEKGVAEEDIFMDHAGFSTYESMYRARDIFCVESMIVVTQKYHLYRALYIADSMGIDSIGTDSDLRPYYGQKVRDIREVAARCKDFFGCMFKPKPTYLGDTIPVSGDGRLSWD